MLQRIAARTIFNGNRRMEGRRKLWKYVQQRGWRAGVKPSAHVAKTRVSPGREAPVYLACIHMQIPIDMTTFTYCIFALGHILARQFPIVGFRPPVRLIDIIGRAADTRLHFYLHTFANQFEPNRSSVLVRARSYYTVLPPSRMCFAVFRPCSYADDWPTIFVPMCRAFHAVIRVSHFFMRQCAQGAGATPIDAGDLAGAAILLDGGAICYAFLGTVT